MAITVVGHPLAQQLLFQLRDVNTEPQRFRHLARQLSTILILEATKGMQMTKKEVQTPLTTVSAPCLAEGLAVIPVLRAGLAMLESSLQLFPDVAVGYVGLERDEKTAQASIYYQKLPGLTNRFCVLVDPMLATGGSASQALQILKDHGARHIAFASVIAAPEGIDRVQADHPDVPLYTAAVDDFLNDQKYIVPGLGDFGDRMYGTM